MTAALPLSAVAGAFNLHPREALEPSATNPRKTFDPQKLAKMARTIREHGIVEPILARAHPTKKGRLEIVAGERRWRAAELAKLDQVPVIVRELTDKQALEIQTIENAQREDLHPLEQAEGYERLIRDFGYTPESIADAIGKSRAHVFQIRKLKNLAPELRKRFADGEIDTTLATVFARVPGEKLQLEAWRKLKGEYHDGCSFRVAADFVRKNYMLDLARAPFPLQDATLRPSAGSCGGCPKRTGTLPDLFKDVKSGNVCTDPVCFQAKRAAHEARQVDKLEAAGTFVIAGAKARAILPYTYSDLDSPDGGVVDPKAKCWDDDKRRPWGTLSKLAGVDLGQLQDPHTGKMRPIVRVDEVRKKLKDKGVKLERLGGDDRGMVAYRAKQNATEEKNRLETEARRRTWLAIRSKTKRLELKDLAIIACAYWDEIWSENQKRIEQMQGWENVTSDSAIKERILKMNAQQLAQLLIDFALAPEVMVRHYYSNDSTGLRKIGARHGVRLDTIRAQVVREAKLKKAAKAAAKKAKARKAPSKVKTIKAKGKKK